MTEAPGEGLPLSAGLELPDRLPLVGRDAELRALVDLVREGDDRLKAAFVAGDGGVGKSRLVNELAERVGDDGWRVVRGRAYPVETGVPYAVFSDAFLPLLREMDPNTLRVLTRGGEAELAYLFPAMSPGGRPKGLDAGVDADEFRTRLLWNFAEFLGSLADREPLLVVLEDLQWADASSLHLLHFLVRQAPAEGLFFACTYNAADRDRNLGLVETERSLTSLRMAVSRHLEPLTREELRELLCEVFDADEEVVLPFSRRLWEWTRGNPFFAEEVLKSLVASGSLRSEDGRWVGWSEGEIRLPRSIRDAVLARTAGLGEDARAVAELAAVVGTRASYGLLASVSDLEDTRLLAAIEELVEARILDEIQADGEISYDFRHPVVRETLYAGFGLQRRRILHGVVAEAMEAFHGDDAMDHADELAYHFARTDGHRLAGKAVRYLAAAGRSALEGHADAEALDYLRAAVERLGPDGAAAPAPQEALGLLSDLARACIRVGDYDAAIEHLRKILSALPADAPERAPALRSLALAHVWTGRHPEALEHLDAALELAEEAGDVPGAIKARLVRGHVLQELGRGLEARLELEAALPAAQEAGDPMLLGRVHRGLELLHVWIGPPHRVREHADRALELAGEAGDLSAEFWARWGMAVHGGMMGDTAYMAEEVERAQALADRLRSPVLRLWTAEMAIELAYGSGDWDTGLSLGEQAIASARSLHQHTLLPRLLVWTAMFPLGRGELERAAELIDEAREIAGVDEPGPHDVHLVVPAYIGLAHYLVGLGDYADAIEAARKGLEIAEGTGYILWAVHRLLPIYAEACLWAGEIDEAARVGKTLRDHSERLNHRLGAAWADACDALVRWKRGDPEQGAVLMRSAAEALEDIPMVPYAARVRRQLAGRLWEVGDAEGALEELRRVHDVFARLGAELELEKARMQFREIGERPPPRGTGEGIGGLTPRELEIAHLVTERKSNKAIGKALGISPRTASTHLSNIYQKLGVGSRGELADLMREQGLV